MSDEPRADLRRVLAWGRRAPAEPPKADAERWRRPAAPPRSFLEVYFGNAVRASVLADPDYWRRRACRRMASTLTANAVGSMIGVPRHGDIDKRSESLDTKMSAPTSAARSRIRLSSWSGQS